MLRWYYNYSGKSQNFQCFKNQLLCRFKILNRRSWNFLFGKNIKIYRICLENYQSYSFFHSDSLASVLPFLFPEICTIRCASTFIGRNCFSTSCYYFPVNVTSLYSQNLNVSLAEKMVLIQHNSVTVCGSKANLFILHFLLYVSWKEECTYLVNG